MGIAFGFVSAARFGPFEVDFRAGELRKDGRRIRLQDQPLHILGLLLERPGEVVTREELQQKLWPSDTFVDFDLGLNNAIYRLREALNDSAETPRYIETLPRRGYRFIAEIHKESVAAERLALPEQPFAESAPQTASIPRPRWRLAVVATGLLAALVGLTLGLNVSGWRNRLFTSASSVQIRSLAVLPLENLTGDPNQEYFVDGMTDALITDLAQIRSLRVISRTSAMQYKGQKKPMTEIGKELNVDAVVEGSVVRSGNRVRINAQLVYAPGDQHLWTKSYEEDLQDVVNLQNLIARAIAEEIRIAVSPQEKDRLARKHAVNPEAYSAYLQGRFFFFRGTRETYAKGVEYFQQAIEKDPNYAAAYVGLSDCYRMLVFSGQARPAEYIPLEETAVRRALELDESLAEAHSAWAVTLYRFRYDWSGAEREFKRALELDPNNSHVRREYGVYLRTAGRYEEAIPEARRAWELDPLSVSTRQLVGTAYYIARRYDEAIRDFSEVVAMDPQHPQSHYLLGLAYQGKDDLPHAIAELEKAVGLSGRGPLHVGALGNVYAAAGRRAEAEKLLAELVSRSAREYITPFHMAVISVGLGRSRETLDWLERAYADRSFPLVIIHSWPWFDPLRPDPRFQDLVRRIGLNPLQPIPRYNPQSPR